MATKKQASDLGYDTGYDITADDFDQWMSEFAKEFGQVPVGNEGEFIDFIVRKALDAEENARQYRPFEFTAKEFNEAADPDGIWDAYDKGIVRGAQRAIRERLARYPKVYGLPG